MAEPKFEDILVEQWLREIIQSLMWLLKIQQAQALDMIQDKLDQLHGQMDDLK